MNLRLLGELIRLRYKLLWAKTRSRNGKIALFVAGYFLLALIGILLAAGGLGAAILAIRAGRAEFVARAVLSGLYLQSTLASVLLGFGMNTVFTETELRKYPLNPSERLWARHLIGIIDPFWFLTLTLELGLVLGLHFFRGYSLGLGMLAMVLLLLSNYALARIIGLLVDRLVSMKGGSAVLLVLVMGFAIGPSAMRPLFEQHAFNFELALSVLRYTAPFGAAAAMTHSGLDAIWGLTVEACWILGLAAIVIIVERSPSARTAIATTEYSWSNRFDRVGALFGPQNGPLVAFWLRFYLRNNRFRALYGLSLPLVGFLTYNLGSQVGKKFGPDGLFFEALGTFGVISFFGTSRIAINQYGYVAEGFRRFFLLPTDPAASLRTGSYACLLLGAPLIPVALLAWIFLGPGSFDARRIFMLSGSAITGLFLLHGISLWATLYSPRRGNYSTSVGNDSSIIGNVVVIGSIVGALFLPVLLSRKLPSAVAVQNWWEVIPLMAVALAFYIFSLRATSALLPVKREALMAIVEGRET
jgi:hypothetical protein